MGALLCINLIFYGQTIDSLKLGSGGGFAGTVTVYKYAKGKVLKGKGLTTISYTDRACICGKDKRNIVKIAQDLFNKDLNYNSPGNTYEFIEIYSKGKVVKLTWTKPMDSADSGNLDPLVLSKIEDIKNIFHKLKFKSI